MFDKQHPLSLSLFLINLGDSPTPTQPATQFVGRIDSPYRIPFRVVSAFRIPYPSARWLHDLEKSVCEVICLVFIQIEWATS